MDELWKDIIDYEGLYQVSNLGRVYSTRAGKVLKGCKANHFGHRFIPLPKAKKYVHRLVAEAFVPNPSNLPCVLHRDDNPLNNSSDNLWWGTKADNNKDASYKKKYHIKKGSGVVATKAFRSDIKE